MASSKGQGLQIALVIFVVFTFALGATSFVMYSSWNEEKNKRIAAEGKVGTAEQNMRTAVDHLQILKELVGYKDIDDFGSRDDLGDPNATTVVGKVRADLDKFTDEANPNYKTAVDKLGLQIAALTAERDKERENLAQLQADWNSRTQQDAIKIAEAETSFQTAKTDLEQVQTESDRQTESQLQEYQAAEKRTAEAMLKQQQVERDFQSLKDNSGKEIHALTVSLNQLKEEKRQAESVGDPVGSIVAAYYLPDVRARKARATKTVRSEVKAPAGYVHIDIGSAKGLSKQTTFSVWDPRELATAYWQERNERIDEDVEKAGNNSSESYTAHKTSGPKGTIEVLEILGPHQAVARITSNRPGKPITKGDKIYSPIFAPGREFHVALVGMFDMTGKGTNDRDLLKRIIMNRGGKVDVEVTDEGQIEGDPGLITPSTNWLVLGDMADPNDEEAKFGLRIAEESAKLQAEAKRLGVQIIDQNKFYSYLGFNPRSPLYDVADFPGGPGRDSSVKNYSTRPDILETYRKNAN